MPKFGEIGAVKIDGRDWSEFTARYREEDIPFTFHMFAYVGAEGTFQMTGWTPQEVCMSNADTRREIALSFRFPPLPNVDSAAQPSASPLASPSPSSLPFKGQRK